VTPSTSIYTVPRQQAGFTLLEILITIAIMSMLITAAVQAFQSITRAEERARAGVGRTRAALVLLDRVERELVGTVLVPQLDEEEPLPQPYVFLAEDRSSSGSNADALRFVTLTASRALASDAKTGPRMISYAVREAEPLSLGELDGDTPLELVRREDPLHHEPEQEISAYDGQVVAENVAGFQLRFQDESTGTWVGEWDSTAPPNLDEVPLSVEVAVTLWERDATGDLIRGEEYQRLVALPLRPLDFLPPEAQLQDEDCGKTVAQCWRENLREAVDLSSGSGRRIQSLYDAVPPSTCWNTSDPELLALKAALEELDADLARECR
jgi:prepilin-type N-terminal cleavage/methylation domain-containing protein